MAALFVSMSLAASLSRLVALIVSAVIEEVSGKGRFRLSAKRIVVLFFLSWFLLFNSLVQHIGFLLDSVLFPAWTKELVFGTEEVAIIERAVVQALSVRGFSERGRETG